MPAVHAFLMTDMEGSTRAWQTDAAAMDELLARHDALLEAAIVTARGTVFKHTGDGMCAVFDDPSDAVTAALDAQRSLSSAGIKVRMGIHAGVATARRDDYFGLAVNRCARVMGSARGGQVLVTLAVEELVRDALPPDVSLRELGLVRLRDLGQDDHLFQLVAPGLPDEFPPPRSRAPGRVPMPRSPLIGRATEVAQLSELVSAGRLVTIVGTGGCGKTRLALEMSAPQQHDLAEAVFVDLSVTSDPRLVAGVIADALGMAAGGSGLESELIWFLESRSVLLVLDNCEHVLDAAAPLIDAVLSACPSVALLATSREPLGVHGEYVWRMPSMSPDEAVALFAERAARGGAVLDSDRDARLIEEICAHLDGIPLAIEIAAAHVAHMRLHSLRALLDDHFPLLIGRDRHAVPRHRTLHSTLSWSYELLDDGQRGLLRRLAVFAGSFTLADASASAGSADASTAQTLGALVDKSLVVFDARVGRYELLETVQRFARAELDRAGETDETFERLYAWLSTEAPGPWSCWLAGRSERGSIDINNVRAVLGWCETSGRPAAAAALAAAHLSLWFLPGRVDEALRWLRLAPTLDGRLSLDERLAWRTAVSWMAFPAMDVERISEIDEHLRLAPPDHPARGSLLFLKAWGQVWGTATKCDVCSRKCATHPMPGGGGTGAGNSTSFGASRRCSTIASTKRSGRSPERSSTALLLGSSTPPGRAHDCSWPWRTTSPVNTRQWPRSSRISIPMTSRRGSTSLISSPTWCSSSRPSAETTSLRHARHSVACWRRRPSGIPTSRARSGSVCRVLRPSRTSAGDPAMRSCCSRAANATVCTAASKAPTQSDERTCASVAPSSRPKRSEKRASAVQR